jgi:hypothetical protein
MQAVSPNQCFQQLADLHTSTLPVVPVLRLSRVVVVASRWIYSYEATECLVEAAKVG